MKRLCAAVLVLFAAKANAEFFTGNQLLSLMQSSNTIDKIHALGYLQGVVDAHSSVTICPPPTVTAGQINDMIKNYLENTPSVRHKTADIIVRDALKPVWPCRQNNSRSPV